MSDNVKRALSHFPCSALVLIQPDEIAWVQCDLSRPFPQETDSLCYGTRHGERLHYTVGVRLLGDGIERFYLPGTLREVQQRGSE